jgi:cysteine dioxygenase
MDDLINNINQNLERDILSLSKCNSILDNYISHDWEKYAKKDIYSPYTRTLVYRNNLFEIYIIVWNVKARAKTHDHAENGCLMKILKGTLKEEQYNTETKILQNIQTYKEDSVSFIHDSLHLHSIENISNDISISLHIYSPPNHKTRYFK